MAQCFVMSCPCVSLIPLMTQRSYHTLTFCHQWCFCLQATPTLAEAIMPGILVKRVLHKRAFPVGEEGKSIHGQECYCEISLVL